MTCRNVVQGKTTFWLHNLYRSGERAARGRSLVIKELSRSTLPWSFWLRSLADSARSSQVTNHLQPTRRRNLGLVRRWLVPDIPRQIGLGDEELLAALRVVKQGSTLNGVVIRPQFWQL
jgi:hypothetical protein